MLYYWNNKHLEFPIIVNNLFWLSITIQQEKQTRRRPSTHANLIILSF